MLQHKNAAIRCVLLTVIVTAVVQRSTAQESLGDAARHQRELKEQQARSAASETNETHGPKGLAEISRELRDKKYQVVRTTLQDSTTLFASIDEVLGFASHDSGLARRTAVNHQLVSEADVAKRISESLEKGDAQRLARSELVLKKFGFLPNSFDLKAFLTGNTSKSLLAFYDPKAKTINLLNWVEISEQLPILAHELTHALQDQNHDILKWRKFAAQQQPSTPTMRVNSDDEEEGSARLAVLEGQAEIVRWDYLLKPYDRTLATTPFVMDLLQNAATQPFDDAIAIHNAPALLKETSVFPYREGLNFELELLRRGGKAMAFTSVFARPPRDTHEILEPEEYIAGRSQGSNLMPDLTSILGDRYEPYDSGVIGELDVRIMGHQFGSEEDGLYLAPNWQGGAYVAVKRASAPKPAEVAVSKPDQGPAVQAVSSKQAQASPGSSAPAGAKISSADLALIYVSRWRTERAAQRFVELYKTSLPKRVKVLDTKSLEPTGCSGKSMACGPLSATRVVTDEGPVLLEIWPNNLVFIAHGFDDESVNQLRQAVLHHVPNGKKTTTTTDLSLRLFEVPEFQAFQEQVGYRILY